MTARQSFPSILNKSELRHYARELLWQLAKESDAVQGAFYIANYTGNAHPTLEFLEGYAHHNSSSNDEVIAFGDGLTGQAARDLKPLVIDNVPEGYITVISGLGSGSPKSLLIYPLLVEDKVVAVIEIATFTNSQAKEKLDTMHTTIVNTLATLM